MESLKIILTCIAAAVVYGIVHDQFTVRVCLEYFTIGHPPIIVTDSPTLLALGWGVIATWWAGLLAGIPVALISRVGTRPKVTASQLFGPISRLLIVMAVTSLIAGVLGYFAAEAGSVWLLEPLRTLVPSSKHSAFIADLWAHAAAYLVGFIGGIVICCRIYLKRKSISRQQPEPNVVSH